MGGTVHGICGNSCPVDSGGEACEMGHVGCPGANGTYLVFDFISSDNVIKILLTISY